MRFLTLLAAVCLSVLTVSSVSAQDRPASPRGEVSTQVGADFDQWIVVDYGRPILRGRTAIFGEGETYGEAVAAGAPVWRLGANRSTRLISDVPLTLGGTTVPAGEHTLFVAFDGDGEWSLVVSGHQGRADYRSDEPGIWGAYNYSADMDVVRVPMDVTDSVVSFDQLTIAFLDVTADGGRLAVMWGNTMASVPFTVAD